MFRHTIVLLCAVLVLSNVGFINARKTFGGGGSRHSYPKPSHGGLSGGGSHSYPSSGSGLSGGGSHGYPSGGTLSGGSRGGGGYPGGGGSSGGHAYPPAGGNSGSHSYPASGSGLSGNNHGNPPHRGTNYPSGGTTNVHHHYHYSPPQQISYASPRGGPAVSYPVYRGAPPTYVYQYKDSGSKYGTLLAGLALFNLGALAGGIYGHSQSHSSGNNYKPQPGEICKFGIKKDNGDYEETRIDCQLITSFIFAEQAKAQHPTNTSVVTTTVTNTTIVNTTNPVPATPQEPGAVNVNINFSMLPNGTLIPMNVTTNGTANVTANESPAPGAGASSVTVMTTVTNTTNVVNALDVKGKPIDVTPGMECYVIRKTPSSAMKKSVPCGLLQTYAEKSLKPNSAARNVPAFTILAVVCAVFVMN